MNRYQVSAMDGCKTTFTKASCTSATQPLYNNG